MALFSVQGSTDCTLLVWQWDLDASGANRSAGVLGLGMLASGGEPRPLCPRPRHVLRGHLSPITHVAIDSELDLCVSASGNSGHLLLHHLRKGQLYTRYGIIVRTSLGLNPLM